VKAEGSVRQMSRITEGEGHTINPEIHGWEGAIASIEVTM